VSAHRAQQERLVAAATLAVPLALDALEIPLDTCILAAAALADALAALGCGRADPIPVSFIACNPPMTRAIFELGRAPSEDEMRAMLDAAPDRYTIGVAPGLRAEKPNRWDGHLVLGWRDRLLLDSTLGQAARPAWGLHLGPLVAAPRPAGALDRLARGTSPALALSGECLIVYWPLRAPGQIPHTTSRHWRRDDPTRRVLADLLVRLAREALAPVAAS
jgi:hypothetical protein